ncbi:MAG: hypothetical protein EXR27_13545 [Betaproteobacteria bacterium]|nr:hypothetical protein [Betaproteobacteria bacterium]
MEKATATAIETARAVVYPWQMDHVGHMNVQFYTARFDEASWHFLAGFGMNATYLREQQRGMGAVEQRTSYKRELLPGTLLRITSELLEARARVVRFLHRMYDADNGEEVATTELTAVHMDTAARRAVPFPDAIRARLAAAVLPQQGPSLDGPSADSIAAVDAAFTSRRSLRRFLPTPVPRAMIEEILAVAGRAPSGTNTQPWQVQVIAGAVRENLSRAIIDAARHHRDEHHEEYQYYPVKWIEPYLARRRKVGWDLYGLLGIAKGDRAGMSAHFERNYLFFDAPVGLIFTIDRVMERGSWLDYGMFLQSVMVAARARGLDTCPQAAFCSFHKVIAAQLQLAPEQQVVCGMSLGYADPEAPENTLHTVREPVASFARFSGFG